ncbi:protein NDNF [Trichomycterus rosablanca]|uniref:protein NDNF n=1 Tax=Trichomycterus rosablanca TaxID=2290929 RepID=UPI002F35F4D0
MSVCWWLYLVVLMGSYTLCSPSPENEVPLRTSTWISEGKSTSVYLNKGHTRRLHFTVRKKTAALTLTVTPCTGTISWSLTATSLQHKPTYQHWSFQKNTPEVWWRNSGGEMRLHSYSGGAVDVYEGPVFDLTSVYTLHIKSVQQDSKAEVYLYEGPASSRVLPELPSDSRVHTLGVGMSSVTLTWRPSSSSVRAQRYEYCVTVNRKQNFASFCAARKEHENQNGVKTKRQQEAEGQRTGSHNHLCVCSVVENVCTVSDLLPNTSYYFDVFLMDRVNSNSVAYEGTMAQTHAESHTHPVSYTPPGVTALRDGRARRVSLNSGENEGRSFRFRPRGGQMNGLLTLQSCNNTNTLAHTLIVSVSARGTELASQEVKDQLIQIWLQGTSSYRINIQLRPKLPSVGLHGVKSERVCVKLQASSAYHRQGAPSLPHTLHVKSFNPLRTCSSVTLAWMGTEERGLYCLYKHKADEESETARYRVIESERRSDTERYRKTPSAAKSETDQHRVKQRRGKSDRISETDQDGVRFGQWKSKLRSEPDQDGEIKSAQRRSRDQDQYREIQRSENVPDKVRWSGWKNETERDRVIWGEQKRETDEVIESETDEGTRNRRSDTDQYRVKRSNQKRVQRSDTHGVIQNKLKSDTEAFGVSLRSDKRRRSEDRTRDPDSVTQRHERRRSDTERHGVIRHKHTGVTDRCLAPESRPPDQRVLCKYFQELDARRAVTTATVGGLEAGTAYTFDVYLIRRWALPVKYHSITVRTRREC